MVESLSLKGVIALPTSYASNKRSTSKNRKAICPAVLRPCALAVVLCVCSLRLCALRPCALRPCALRAGLSLLCPAALRPARRLFSFM